MPTTNTELLPAKFKPYTRQTIRQARQWEWLPPEQREAVLFKTWLYQIARNRLIDHWRRQGRKAALHDSYDEAEHGRADPAAGPEQQLSFSRDQQRLAAALADLPAEQREVFLLRAQGDLELHEIAELTATAQETVKSRLRYALQKLRRLLGEPATIEEKSA